MWSLNESLKQSVNKVDATMNNEHYGIIVVEDNKTYLRELDSNKNILNITDEHEIEVLNFGERQKVTYNDVLNRKERYSGGPLFAGLEAFVK
ncbi:MAG TPA: hypothetical protein VK094_04145 [Pseudogracilibacillus sp.]|nr:hypothetical protein [Pseudogracilibacillus sp.]